MRITELRIRNYRTLEHIDLKFPSAYTAICGANDSGKTNVVRAIRALMKEEASPFDALARGHEDFSLKEDYPKWSDIDPSKREIAFDLVLEMQRERDAGLFQFVVKQLGINPPDETLNLTVSVILRGDRPEADVSVKTLMNEDKGLIAQEVLKRLQSSRSILFHNSTQIEPYLMFGESRAAGYVREISGQHEALVTSMKKTVNKGLAKISKQQQAEFENLLGRLETKYKVGLETPAFDFGFLPFRITLGGTKYEVPLDDWGSGTKNRTLILLTLFRARQIADAPASAAKTTPVIVVEEPESFLHPSAQAEFGRVLQDLATEFQVQVIVTTHSPYLLSIGSPESNILLRRKSAYRQLRETERVDTSGDNWMIPFGHALGLDTEQFHPWKSLILGGSDSILLVEGDTDREYFEMLRDDTHGDSRLRFTGEIAPYQGTGNLHSTVLLRFVTSRYRKCFVTFDLDAADRLEKCLRGLEMEKGRHYLPVGLSIPGKRNIEGLLPDRVTAAVYAANPTLVQTATAGSKEEQESARGALKKLLLAEFKKTAQPGTQDFTHFYALTKLMNKALA